jgi:hypothetical protein
MTRVLTGRPPTPPERRRNERPVCRQCGKPGETGQDSRTGGGYLSHQSHPGPEDAHQSTTRIDNVVHRVHGHLGVKMMAVNAGRRGTYLGAARDEQLSGGGNVTLGFLGCVAYVRFP